jgi:hypothetical protein
MAAYEKTVIPRPTTIFVFLDLHACSPTSQIIKEVIISMEAPQGKKERERQRMRENERE